MKNTETKANYCTVLLFRGFETVAFSLEVLYTKWKKYQWENRNILRRFEPASFSVDVHDATIELVDSVKIGSNTTVWNKTHFNVTLARPALINSSATQYQGAAIFPQK